MPDRCAVRAALVIGMLGLVSLPALAQSGGGKRPNLSASQRLEVTALNALVDAVAAGGLPGGDAYLTWTPHFMRASDGKTYVPFTLTIEEATGEFDDVGLYVRVTRPTIEPQDPNGRRIDDTTGTAPGEMPISVPEAQFGPRGVPTPGQHSAMLASIESSLKNQKVPPVFEDVHFLEIEKSPAGHVAQIRRALAVPPGEYDVFVAIRESGKRTADAKSAVLRQTLTVPAFPPAGLAVSSIMVADRLVALDKPLSEREQAERPYAFGSAEIVPIRDLEFGRDDTLSLLFFVYNAAADEAGKPNLTIGYEFYQIGVVDSFFIATQPQQLNGAALPADFDLRRAGNQLPVDATIPLGSFSPGQYRLRIEVTDEISGASVREDLAFSVN